MSEFMKVVVAKQTGREIALPDKFKPLEVSDNIREVGWNRSFEYTFGFTWQRIGFAHDIKVVEPMRQKVIKELTYALYEDFLVLLRELDYAVHEQEWTKATALIGKINKQAFDIVP